MATPKPVGPHPPQPTPAAVAAAKRKASGAGLLGNAGRVNGVDTNGASNANVDYRTTNPYPDNPNSKFVGGKWVITKSGTAPKKVLAGKVTKTPAGKTAYQKWLESKNKASGTKAPYSFDPLAGMPTDTELTPYPTMDSSDIPDGSDVPYVPGRNFQQGKAGLLDPTAYAKLVGSAAFKPIIDSLTGQQDRLQSGIGQANDMMDKSFGQAADSSLRGAQVVRDSNAQANQGLTDLAARMAQAAGGDPTAAAAVGQATANQQAADTRFANIDAEAQAAEAAAANRDAGTAKLGYKTSTDKAIADLAEKVGQARTQGQQAQGAALKDALGFNSDQKTAQTSRDVAKQEAWLAGQMAGPQIEAGRLANEGTRAALKINKHNVDVSDWSTLNTAQQNQNVQRWTQFSNVTAAKQIKAAMATKSDNPVMQALLDPTGAGAAIEKDVISGMLDSNGPSTGPKKMFASAVETMHLQYPDAPSSAVKALAAQFVSKQIPRWNTLHPNFKFKLVNGVPVKA